MTNKIIAVQGNNLNNLNPLTDTSIFLAKSGESKGYKIFYYEPENLSIKNKKVFANGSFIKIDYSKKKFFKIIKKSHIDLSKVKFILVRQDPPFNLEYISTTYILDTIKNKVRVINNPTSIRNISEKLYSMKFINLNLKIFGCSFVTIIDNFLDFFVNLLCSLIRNSLRLRTSRSS